MSADRASMDWRLNYARERLGMTWEELAESVGMSVQGLRNIRTGKSIPRVGTRRKLEVALNLPEGGLSLDWPGPDAYTDEEDEADISNRTVMLTFDGESDTMVLVRLKRVATPYDKVRLTVLLQRIADEFIDMLPTSEG